jgi:signal transduction histidine kinase
MARRITGKTVEADAMLRDVTNEASLTRTLKLKLTIGQVSLFPLIERVRVDFQDAPQAIRVVSERIEGYWSWATMESALRDLVIIARQFSAPSGGITIAAKVDFGRLLLSVHGDGFFLSGNEVEALLEKTGDPYGDSLATSRGLPHVRDVAESHGGSLVIRSARQSGTTFTINIPLDARPYAE